MAQVCRWTSVPVQSARRPDEVESLARELTRLEKPTNSISTQLDCHAASLPQGALLLAHGPCWFRQGGRREGGRCFGQCAGVLAAHTVSGGGPRATRLQFLAADIVPRHPMRAPSQSCTADATTEPQQSFRY